MLPCLLTLHAYLPCALIEATLSRSTTGEEAYGGATVVDMPDTNLYVKDVDQAIESPRSEPFVVRAKRHAHDEFVPVLDGRYLRQQDKMCATRRPTFATTGTGMDLIGSASGKYAFQPEDHHRYPGT